MQRWRLVGPMRFTHLVQTPPKKVLQFTSWLSLPLSYPSHLLAPPTRCHAQLELKLIGWCFGSVLAALKFGPDDGVLKVHPEENI